jgi:hypothetical protein
MRKHRDTAFSIYGRPVGGCRERGNPTAKTRGLRGHRWDGDLAGGMMSLEIGEK